MSKDLLSGLDLLQKYCESENKNIKEPFVWDKWVGATDGFLAIRILSDNINCDKLGTFKPASTLEWEPSIEGEWVDLPPYKLSKKLLCDKCKGSGHTDICVECGGSGHVEFESDYNFYIFSCKTCDGEGDIPGDTRVCDVCDGKGLYYDDIVLPIEFGGGFINAFLLEKIKDLPKVKLFNKINSKGQYYNFKFDGGQGVLMMCSS